MKTIRMECCMQGYCLLALLFGLTLLNGARSECNLCSVETEQACVSETEFRLCENGQPTGKVIQCPGDNVCSVTGSCQPRDDAVITPCAECEQCDTGNVFACRGPQKYALCLGTDTPSDMEGECGEGYVCNIDTPYICSSNETYTPSCVPATEATTTTTSTTSTSTTTTTEPSPIAGPTTFCNYVKMRGRFPIGNDRNTTCRQFVLCMVRNDVWVGALYYCPNNLYFDDVSRSCISSTTPPARCNGTVRSQWLFNIPQLTYRGDSLYS